MPASSELARARRGSGPRARGLPASNPGGEPQRPGDEVLPRPHDRPVRLLDACGDDTAARDMVIGHEIGHLKAGHLDHLLAHPAPGNGDAVPRRRLLPRLRTHLRPLGRGALRRPRRGRARPRHPRRRWHAREADQPPGVRRPAARPRYRLDDARQLAVGVSSALRARRAARSVPGCRPAGERARRAARRRNPRPAHPAASSRLCRRRRRLGDGGFEARRNGRHRWHGQPAAGGGRSQRYRRQCGTADHRPGGGWSTPPACRSRPTSRRSPRSCGASITPPTGDTPDSELEVATLWARYRGETALPADPFSGGGYNWVLTSAATGSCLLHRTRRRNRDRRRHRLRARARSGARVLCAPAQRMPPCFLPGW